MAEYYHVFNYMEFNPVYIATLVLGLGADSRVMRKLSGCPVKGTELLIARCYDVLNMILWTKTKDAQKNRNRPKSLADLMLGKQKENEKEIMKFENKDAFDKKRREILKERR